MSKFIPFVIATSKMIVGIPLNEPDVKILIPRLWEELIECVIAQACGQQISFTPKAYATAITLIMQSPVAEEVRQYLRWRTKRPDVRTLAALYFPEEECFQNGTPFANGKRNCDIFSL